MPKSLKCKLSSLRYKRLLTDEEYKELIQKLEGHDREIRNKAIDEFAERMKNHLNQFDFWKYGITDGRNYEARNYDHMIDGIAEQMKGGGNSEDNV